MHWVLDAAVTLAWCFEGERTVQTDALLDRLTGGESAVVPSIWPLEIANVLALAVRKGRINAAKRRQFLTMLQNTPISVDNSSTGSVFNEISAVADKHHLTVYDASYLELAMRRGLPLATLDDDLRKAAHGTGVQLI